MAIFGLVNLFETSAESAYEVGRCVPFEAIFSPKVGRLSIRVGGKYQQSRRGFTAHAIS